MIKPIRVYPYCGANIIPHTAYPRQGLVRKYNIGVYPNAQCCGVPHNTYMNTAITYTFQARGTSSACFCIVTSSTPDFEPGELLTEEDVAQIQQHYSCVEV